jgi:extracellular elastinolytic metalloproteinase
VRKGLILVALVAFAAILLPAASPGAGGPTHLANQDHGKPGFDVRGNAATAHAAPTQAQLELRDSLGSSGVLDVDKLTGTPRVVAKLDGFLTGPSNATGANVAMDYVKAHLDAFGLSQRDLGTFRLSKSSYTDESGTQHLYWEQVIQGIPAFDNELAANVTKDGRLINVFGSPVPRLNIRATDPGVSAKDALVAALKDAGSSATPDQTSQANNATKDTQFAGGNSASLVLFRGVDTLHLAWLVRARADSTGDYDYVIDARNADVLWRQNMVKFASGYAWDYFSSDLLPAGVGTQTLRAYPAGWGGTALNAGTALSGNNAHVYKDVNDDNSPAAGDEIPANAGGPAWQYPFNAFSDGGTDNCSTHWQCSWTTATPTSWQTNINQNAEQVWYYVNNFHDWLMNANIGFTEASGNFQVTNSSGQGLGNDAVQAQVDDGAAITDGTHRLNANMSTQQDGLPPRMQMYLFPGGGMNAGSPTANGGDDASVIYHEYTHGLSHRLVKLASGVPALGTFQSDSMGEAWSDWYAMDFLMAHGFDTDTATVGDVQVGYFIDGGTTVPLRSEPMDCPADGNSYGGVCSGGQTPHFGGYTYGDMGHVINGPEVHADGEIWAQTIWQLRQQLGSSVSEKIITDGMRLSPSGPSMLDERNAILQADNVDFAGAHRSTIWSVFANRGMGYFAFTDSSFDTTPTEDFTTEASAQALPKGTVSGNITENGAPLAGVTVGLGQVNGVLIATTDGSGNYSIPNVPQHSYAIFATKTGYDVASGPTTVTVNGGATTTANFQLRRDWASSLAGGVVAGFNGQDYTNFGCGPGGAIDQSLFTGWGSDPVSNGGNKFVTVQLPQTISMTGYAIDPGATCGDPDASSLAGYQIWTSPDGTTFTQRNTGTYSAGNNHQLNTTTFGAAIANVRYVRLYMTGNQGGSFMDMSELEVFGTTGGGGSTINWAAQNSVDFNNDHITDLGALYRGLSPQDSLWYAPGTFQIYFGATTDIPVPGDYNGDGKTDAAIFRPSTGLWYGPGTGLAQIVIQMNLGQAGDIPIPGDYDGDGKTDPAIYRPSTGLFFAVLSGGGTKSSTFGAPGDIPVPRDYDGDGKTDFGIYRQNASNGLSLWYAPLSGGGVYQIYFGAAGDKPVPGDYDGDKKAEAVIFRSSTGLWYGPKSSGGLFQTIVGQAGDIPIPGYYDNNLVMDPAYYRPSTGLWFAVLSGGGTARFDNLGQSTDVPVQKRPTLAGGL